MRGYMITAFLLFGASLAAETMMAPSSVIELHGGEGTSPLEGFFTESLSARASSKVTACLKNKHVFEATCNKELENVIVLCKDGTAWKYSNLTGTSLKSKIRHCEIKHVCVKCGGNSDSRCPKHWDCGKCVANTPKCTAPQPTEKPKEECKDFDKDWCQKYKEWGLCRHYHYASRCPDACHSCTADCEDFNTKTCERFKKGGLCKRKRYSSKCPKTCHTCPESSEAPTPTPAAESMTPTPSPTPDPTPQPTKSPADCLKKPVEVCIAAGMYSSRGEEGWKAVQTFVEGVLHGMKNVFPNKNIRVATVIFGVKVYTYTQFTPFFHRLVELLQATAYKEGGSELDQALKRCANLFRTPTEDADRVVVLITDGNARNVDGSVMSFQKVVKQANSLKAKASAIFVMGIADNGNEARLKKLTGKVGEIGILNRIEKFKTKKSFRNYAKKIFGC